MSSPGMLGCLLGGALGDSLGLPSEGMSAGRIARRWGGTLDQRFLFGQGMVSVVGAGGDTDTVAFVAGSLIGIEVGREGMPAEWVEGLNDVPVNAKWLEEVVGGRCVSFPAFPMSLIRNLIFLFVVLCHGFRRLFPPY